MKGDTGHLAATFVVLFIFLWIGIGVITFLLSDLSEAFTALLQI